MIKFLTYILAFCFLSGSIFFFILLTAQIWDMLPMPMSLMFFLVMLGIFVWKAGQIVYAWIKPEDPDE